MRSMHEKVPHGLPIIATRVTAEQFIAIENVLGTDKVRYRPDCRIAHTVPQTNKNSENRIVGSVAVLCAGTSDVAIAEEAATLLELSGVSDVIRLYDVGVAGLHRLLSNLDKINSADVVIVCAGLKIHMKRHYFSILYPLFTD